MDCETKDAADFESAIAKYCAFVYTSIECDDSVIFGNYSNAHAECVVKAFAESAKESILLMTGAFSAKFYTKDVFNALVDAAKRGVSIKIVTSDGSHSDIENLKRLVLASGENADVQFFVATYHGESPAPHFMVVDGKRYRQERGAHAPEAERPIVQAEVCCNGKEKAQELCHYFNNAWEFLKVIRRHTNTPDPLKSK